MPSEGWCSLLCTDDLLICDSSSEVIGRADLTWSDPMLVSLDACFTGSTNFLDADCSCTLMLLAVDTGVTFLKNQHCEYIENKNMRTILYRGIKTIWSNSDLRDIVCGNSKGKNKICDIYIDLKKIVTDQTDSLIQ